MTSHDISDNSPIHFVGIVNPVACGVRAYGETLAGAFRQTLLDVDECWIPSDMITIRSVFQATRALLSKASTLSRGTVVVWHYAAYGYTFRGIPSPGVLFGALCSLRGIKLITILHEPGAEPMPHQSWKYRLQVLSQYLALSVVVRSSAAVVVTTERRSRKIRARFNTEVRVAPVFSNLPLTHAGVAERSVSNTQRIGIFGFGAPNARADVVLHGIKPVCSDERTEVIMAGAPGRRSKYSDLWVNTAQVIGIADRLSFTGILPINELARLLAECDVIILPYDEGPNGRKGTLSGVLGLGCAVVALDGPERWDELVRAGAVALVEPNPAALSKALACLLENSVERKALQRRARAFYQDHLAIELTVQTLSDLVLG